MVEPAISKIKSLKFATEAAITILRIDDLIQMQVRGKSQGKQSAGVDELGLGLIGQLRVRLQWMGCSRDRYYRPRFPHPHPSRIPPTPPPLPPNSKTRRMIPTRTRTPWREASSARGPARTERQRNVLLSVEPGPPRTPTPDTHRTHQPTTTPLSYLS